MRLKRLDLAGCLVLCLFSLGCSVKSETAEEHLSHAMKNIAAAEYQKAEKELQEVLRLDSSNQKAARELGIIYYDQGQIREAFPLLKKSAETNPNDLDVQLKLALLYFAGRDLGSARELAQQIIEKNSEQEDAILLLSDLPNNPDELQEVQRFFDDHIKNHDSAAHHLALGAIALHQQKFAAAEPELKAALERNPKSNAANLALATLLCASTKSQSR